MVDDLPRCQQRLIAFLLKDHFSASASSTAWDASAGNALHSVTKAWDDTAGALPC